MKKLLTIAVLLAATTHAWALSYTIGNGSSVSLNTSDPGLALDYSLSSSLSGRVFDLADGESTTFNFFSIWTTESAVNADDTVAKAITATLDFLNPNMDAVVSGSTYGTVSLLGFLQSGVVTWAGPAVLNAFDRTFTVSLNNATFNSGMFWGLNEGRCDGAVIKATVTQNSSKVPDGGMTLALFGSGLLGLVALRRKMV